MKQSLQYSLKVTLTTLLLSQPITFIIMMAYMALLPILMENYSFNVNLDVIEVVVFVVIMLLALLFNVKKVERINGMAYHKSKIIIRSVITSIAVFCIYLLVIGKLNDLSIDEFLVTYGPMFFVGFICMKLFPLRNEVAISV